MEVVVDRIEGNYAVVEIEKGIMSKIPLELVPNVKEGNIISIKILSKNKEKEEKVNKLVSSLFSD